MGNDLLLIAVGCVTGVLAGMLGAGGGFATVVLLLAAGATPHEAVGTGIVYLAVMGGWATFTHLQKTPIDRRLALAVGGSATAAALVGAQITHAMGGQQLALALGLFTALVSGIIIGGPVKTRRPVEAALVPAAAAGAASGGGVALLADAPALESSSAELTYGAVVGGLLGACKGLFALGAAFVIVPAASQLTRVRREVVLGTTILAIFVAGVVGGVRHLTMHHVDPEMLAFLIPGGLVGSFLGARWATGMTSAQLRRVFLTLMGVASVYLLTFAASYA
jgi:uncharacterized membrane protein YfcA